MNNKNPELRINSQGVMQNTPIVSFKTDLKLSLKF